MSEHPNYELFNTILLEQEGRILSGDFKDFELYKVSGKCVFKVESDGVPTGELIFYVCTKKGPPYYKQTHSLKHSGINYLLRQFRIAAIELQQNLNKLK